MVTFGAVTLMQTVGHDRSLVIMERADPLLLLVVLPLVPVGLIIGQMIRWEETVRNGILLPKLFRPTVRKICSSVRVKLLKFEAEGREFAKILRSF